IEDAQVVRDALQAKPVVVPVRAGKNGRLFGGVTTKHIAEAIAQAGQTVDRRKIEIGQTIKSLGDHQVQIRLHDDVSATVDVKVVAACRAADLSGPGHRMRWPGLRIASPSSGRGSGEASATCSVRCPVPGVDSSVHRATAARLRGWGRPTT